MALPTLVATAAQSIDIFCLLGPQQQLQQWHVVAGWDKQMDRQTHDSCIDHAPHTMWAVPIILIFRILKKCYYDFSIGSLVPRAESATLEVFAMKLRAYNQSTV